MARIPTLKPRIGVLPPRIGVPARDERARSQMRDSTQPWRAWYKTARWQKLRWSVLKRDLFTCKRCGAIDASKGGMHCDHVQPHGGDETRFWAGPFQTLCAHCHNSVKQSEERGGKLTS